VILHDLEPEAAEYGAKIIKIDVDEHKEIAKKFGVSSMPTLIVFKNGEIVDRQTGLTDRRIVKRLLKM
jgi:thioredoxin 1